jgi:hypothetical protein
MIFTWLSEFMDKSRNEIDIVPVEIALPNFANFLRALREASIELVYTTKLISDRWWLV